VEGAAVTVIVL